MIKLQIIGHLGRDASVNTVNGKTVINFSVAHTESYKDAQGVKHDVTTWVNCSFWVERTTLAPYLTKGTMVYVEGIPSANSYTNQHGRLMAELKLRAAAIKLLGSKRENQQPGQYQPDPVGNPTHQIPEASEITEPIDDLPF